MALRQWRRTSRYLVIVVLAVAALSDRFGSSVALLIAASAKMVDPRFAVALPVTMISTVAPLSSEADTQMTTPVLPFFGVVQIQSDGAERLWNPMPGEAVKRTKAFTAGAGPTFAMSTA